MSESCNSRHFSWLTKSCFPNPQHHHPLHQPHLPLHRPTTTATTISSLPDDLLLDILSRLPHSSLPSLPLVSRRWSHLLHSPSFLLLRRLRGQLRRTLFAVSVTDSTLLHNNHPFLVYRHSTAVKDSSSETAPSLAREDDAVGIFRAATHVIGQDSPWKTSHFLADRDDAVAFPPGIFDGGFSHSRVLAIGRKIYVIGRTATFELHTWTGNVAAKSPMIFPRKKFAAAAVGGKIYVAGGAARTSSVEEYDPDTDSWRVVSDAPRKRYGCVGTSVGDVFYVIGGLKIGASTGEDFSRAAASNYYASSMDLYDAEARGWLRSRAVPGGGCVVAACAVEEGFVYVLTSHAVELSFWRFDARRKNNGGGGGGAFGEWCRMKSPPLPVRVRLDSTMRFNCVGVGNKVVVIQVMGSVDDLLRRGGGRRGRGVKDAAVLVYDGGAGQWSRGPDLPEVIRRAAFVCVEC
ncbi:F-box/kelch-repeat protein At5g26960 [Rhododendron vialii]|uniref:F-box/kelch-repeat protein At5g26960 n=1 Tax=Rhododendron vialii TaxID=182163 RepID=UPI00265F968B|nr:F-box/kelch-repeat protein At5g26960 [Rhododendron vialii]